MRLNHIRPFCILFVAVLFSASSCSGGNGNTYGNKSKDIADKTVDVPQFNADSAYAFCAAQCYFGYRMVNTPSHEQCGEWIMQKFAQYGLDVTTQKATLKGYDGTQLNTTNIIASYQSDIKDRVLLCAHWDTRPWADNDPDEANWHKPVKGANDGASGVAVMLEIARQLKDNDSLSIGVDFICFDAEDWGAPQWSDYSGEDNTWALGAQYWAENPHVDGYNARYGILLDMVGGVGATFHQEGMSKHYAPSVVKEVWSAARSAGYGSLFPNRNGGYVTDDHVPINEGTNIPTIDIIGFYPDCQDSSFGPYWHTIYDTMENIDKNILKAVGQTVIYVIFNE